MVANRPFRLREWREHHFLTQAELSERSGISERAIIRLERPNGPTPRISTVRKLATALGVEPADLLRAPGEGNNR